MGKIPNGSIVEVCGCVDIEGGPVPVEADGACQSVTCGDCGADWVDCYEKVSTTITHPGDRKKEKGK